MSDIANLKNEIREKVATVIAIPSRKPFAAPRRTALRAEKVLMGVVGTEGSSRT